MVVAQEVVVGEAVVAVLIAAASVFVAEDLLSE